jgi:hypothetical protein
MAAPIATNEPGIDLPITPFEKRVGHHPGLFALFFAEMWERFSYYGMRALLIFYMTKDFLDYSDERAYSVYGAYTALVYMTPFIGGMVADRLLGQRAAVIIGGSLMALGHLIDDDPGNSTAFFVALALLICGNGFFKPNIGTIVGRLYGGERLNPQARRRLHDLLHGREPRRGHRPAGLRVRGRDLRLALRLRPRDHRHDDRPRHLRGAHPRHADHDRGGREP